MHVTLRSICASLRSIANSSRTNFCGEGGGATWRGWGSYWPVGICFCVSLFVIPRCKASSGPCPVASCLPEKSAKRIEHTASSEKRLQLYQRIAQEQISKLTRYLRVYRPLREAPFPPRMRFPHRFPPPEKVPDQFLTVADCAWTEMSKELAAWKPQGRDWKFKVRQIHHRVTQAHQALQDAEALASPLPSLQSQIRVSRSKAEGVEAQLLKILNGSTP